jgi:L,D-transpeptidase YcbB
MQHTMSVRMTPAQARTLAAAGLMVLGAAACRTEADTGLETIGHSTGDVAVRIWEPAEITAVHSIPVADIRQATTAALDNAGGGAVSKETRTHARRLYDRYAGGPLWLRDDGLDRERAGQLMRALAEGDRDALDLSRYPLGDLGQALSAIDGRKDVTAEQLAAADALLTLSYVALGEDLLTGQMDPKEVTSDWHIDATEERVDSALVRALRSEPLDKSIASMRPQDEGYAGLQESLQRYRQLAAAGGWGRVADGRTVKPGERDTPARMAALRQRLRTQGFAADSAPDAGLYDRSLAGAVARYQARHGIVVDSILGSETVQSLNISPDRRAMQIAANLERFRWMPRTLGDRYILVNVAGYRLDAYDSGRKVMEMKVIVGRDFEGRSTPVFADTMKYVVFRPYWNVTDMMIEKDIMPKLGADPGYLDKNRFEWFQSEGKRRIRQKPGPENSLGLVKFMFPNSYNIYLHDTPDRELFDKDQRAFSSGCIRLEKPEELAQWVLGWDASRVDAAMQGSQNDRHVNLSRPVPVFITYQTAYWNDGALFFGNDLYRRDDGLTDAMRNGALPGQGAQSAAGALRALAERWSS